MGVARVSDFFSKESKSEIFFLFLEGVKVREDWLVQVNLLYKESKFKNRFFFIFWGGRGVRGGLSK